MKLNELREKGFWNVKMAVNISNRHVTRKEFVDKLCEILNKYSIEKWRYTNRNNRSYRYKENRIIQSNV